MLLLVAFLSLILILRLSQRYASYLDLNFEIDRLRAKLYDKKMFSFFPLWTSHLYVGTFKQHLYMEYLPLSWSNTGIPDCVVSIMISLIEGCCLQDFCVMFCRLLFVLFSFLHCIVWPSMNYGFWSPLWWLQIFLDVLLHSMFIFRVIQATRANIFLIGNKLVFEFVFWLGINLEYYSAILIYFDKVEASRLKK